MKLNYAHYSFGVTNLGPEKRSVLWVQKCCFQCPGCVAPGYREEGGLWIDTEELADIFLKNSAEAEGITISGGEPFLQPEAVVEFIRILKKEKDFGIIIYTGFIKEELEEKMQHRPAVGDLLKETDLLIDGRYVEALDSQEVMRGSSNQRLWFFTSRYEGKDWGKERKMKIRFENNKMVMIGIPGKEDREKWENLKNYVLSIGGERSRREIW